MESDSCPPRSPQHVKQPDTDGQIRDPYRSEPRIFYSASRLASSPRVLMAPAMRADQCSPHEMRMQLV